MYAWGEDMSDWARPAAYKYKGGRAAKAKRREDSKLSVQKGGRSYLNRREPNMDLVSPFGRQISTESTTPLVVAVDVTGSMASWPGEIFDRLPLLYQTLSQYRPDLEISFAAIGDATSDSYPLQITDFAAGVSLEDQLNAIYGEGGGGGGKRESYELFAYYLLTQTRAPNAERPYLIIYGDEGFYPEVASAQLRYYLGGRERRNRDSLEVFGALCEAWNVFHLRKPYGARGSAQDAEIEAQWARAIGPERIVSLPSAERAVDLALGLVARGWGHYDDFEENLSARQPKSALDMIRGRVGAVGDLR